MEVRIISFQPREGWEERTAEIRRGKTRWVRYWAVSAEYDPRRNTAAGVFLRPRDAAIERVSAETLVFGASDRYLRFDHVHVLEVLAFYFERKKGVEIAAAAAEAAAAETLVWAQAHEGQEVELDADDSRLEELDRIADVTEVRRQKRVAVDYGVHHDPRQDVWVVLTLQWKVRTEHSDRETATLRLAAAKERLDSLLKRPRALRQMAERLKRD